MGELRGRDALQGFGLGQESLVLTFKFAGEHVKLVGLRKGLHQGGGFLLGLLDQGACFARRHHGWTRVEVDRDGLTRGFVCASFWGPHGVCKRQNQGSECQHPGEQDEQVAQAMPGLGLFLDILEKGHIGKSHTAVPSQLQQVKRDGYGQRQQSPEYVRPSPHNANLVRFLRHGTGGSEGVFAREGGAV